MGYRIINAVGTELITPGLPNHECSGYRMDHAWVTESLMQWVRNGSRLGYRIMNAVGMEWITHELPNHECS